MKFFSDVIDLGEVQADQNGLITTTVTIPDAVPGVHRIVVAGDGTDGIEVANEIKVTLDEDTSPIWVCVPEG